MQLLMEKSRPGRGLSILPKSDVPSAPIEEEFLRAAAPELPQLSEVELSRHYSALERRSHGVNDGFYPLGSCTMKYNPAVNERIAALPGFAGVHPLQELRDSQGCLEVLVTAEKLLSEITGMDGVSFQPAAGAHGELTGMLIIKAYHKSRGDAARVKILVPDAAHGTNPASAAMAGFEVVSIPSTPEGRVDLEALKSAAGPDTAGLMLTNPNTLGVFDENILEITRIVREAGGLNYYDGANLNAVMGVARPGDMGFDLIHLNLHKTFSTPHGGGGPGSGPVGVKKFLLPFLPLFHAARTESGYAFETPDQSIGSVRSFYGNFLVVVRALCYILSLGREGIPEASRVAVLNANYLLALLKDDFAPATEGSCMHEFVLSLEAVKKETGVSALDLAKGLIDRGIHPPTMYFPLIVHEALMFEPTETETKETLEEAASAMKELLQIARNDPEALKTAPHLSPVSRPDEVKAARTPVLKA